MQTSYVNALILESWSIIISSFNFKELWEILEFRFFSEIFERPNFHKPPPSPRPNF